MRSGVTIMIWWCVVVMGIVVAHADDVSDVAPPVSALDALPHVVRVRCQAVEIDLKRIPAELADEISPEWGTIKIFRDERNTGLPFIRPADPREVQQLLSKLTRCGAATIRAEPTLIAHEGRSAEVEIHTLVPAASSPLGQEFCYISCTFAATPHRCEVGWVVEVRMELAEPDFASDEVVVRPPLPARPGQKPPRWIPTMVSSGSQTTISLPRGKLIPIGGSVTSRTTNDGAETQRVCQIVLLSVEEDAAH